MSNYLVTGGFGFVGSHLVEELHNAGNQVTVLDNLSNGKLENLQHLKETPLLYRHKGQLHLVAASQCVKDILHKKKESELKLMIKH